jgi:hypothetical protein
VYVYVRVGVHVYVYVYANMYAYVCVYVSLHISVHVCVLDARVRLRVLHCGRYSTLVPRPLASARGAEGTPLKFKKYLRLREGLARHVNKHTARTNAKAFAEVTAQPFAEVIARSRPQPKPLRKPLLKQPPNPLPKPLPGPGHCQIPCGRHSILLPRPLTQPAEPKTHPKE